MLEIDERIILEILTFVGEYNLIMETLAISLGDHNWLSLGPIANQNPARGEMPDDQPLLLLPLDRRRPMFPRQRHIPTALRFQELLLNLPDPIKEIAEGLALLNLLEIDRQAVDMGH